MYILLGKRETNGENGVRKPYVQIYDKHGAEGLSIIRNVRAFVCGPRIVSGHAFTATSSPDTIRGLKIGITLVKSGYLYIFPDIYYPFSR